MYKAVFKTVEEAPSVVAVKMLSCKLLNDQLLHQMEREIAILRKVSHDKNVVQFYGACLPKATASQPTVGGIRAMLVMEYMEVRSEEPRSSTEIPNQIVTDMLCLYILTCSCATGGPQYCTSPRHSDVCVVPLQ